MSLLFWRNNGGAKDEPVNEYHPLPVQLRQPPGTPDAGVTASGKLAYTNPLEVPGIAAADALDANDQFGTLMQIPVPKKGVIVKGLYFDPDNEGLSVELWLFNRAVTLAASDAAFALSDADLMAVEGVITMATFKTATNGQIGLSADTPLWYQAPAGYLWAALKTVGAPTIAAGAMPRVSLLIERYSDD